MMRPLSARERKLVAVGLLVLLVALVWGVIVAPVIDGFTQRAEQRALLRTAYARNSRLISAVPALRRQAERQSETLRAFVIPATNPVLARAALRDRLRRDVTALGGEVIGLQDIPAPTGTVRAGVQVRMTLEQMQRLLVSLNDTPPYLVTESLRVSADRALETGHLDLLDVRLEVSVPHSPAAS
jgi:general secretion pathway protein M